MYNQARCMVIAIHYISLHEDYYYDDHVDNDENNGAGIIMYSWK